MSPWVQVTQEGGGKTRTPGSGSEPFTLRLRGGGQLAVPAHAHPAGAGDLPATTRSYSRATATSPPSAASIAMKCVHPQPQSVYPNGLWVHSVVFPPSTSRAVCCFYKQTHLLLLVKVWWVLTCGHTVMDGSDPPPRWCFGVVSNCLFL